LIAEKGVGLPAFLRNTNGRRLVSGWAIYDDRYELRRKLARQVGRVGAFQNFIDEIGRSALILEIVHSIADEPPASASEF